MFTTVETVTPLTRREREIAHLVANGQTSREVAESCFLSVRTVENHLARIYDKLGVRGRNELAEALKPLMAEGAA
jgi:DNA-binding CsgD family transcriptional regulator